MYSLLEEEITLLNTARLNGYRLADYHSFRDAEC